MSNTLISVAGLTKQFQPGQASGIANLSFDIEAGQIFAIIGESGSGKSTLLKTIYGLLKPDQGSVFFEGKKVKGPDEQLVPGHPEMKMVTQDFSLNIYAKVYDNIASQLSNTNVKFKESRTQQMMEQLRITHLSQKKIVELSGGEQQRVAIARALASNTRVLLLDEPFSQVDAVLKNQLRADLKRLVAETGVTVILVSHDPSDGLFLADQLLILKNGALQQTGSPRQVYEQPATIYTARLLGNAVVLGKQEAATAGITAGGEQVVFYPEWVEVDGPDASLTFQVRDIYFKGFYMELLLERDGIEIRSLQLSHTPYSPGQQVTARITRHLEF